jgi:hypothetical protein
MAGAMRGAIAFVVVLVLVMPFIVIVVDVMRPWWRHCVVVLVLVSPSLSSLTWCLGHGGDMVVVVVFVVVLVLVTVMPFDVAFVVDLKL